MYTCTCMYINISLSDSKLCELAATLINNSTHLLRMVLLSCHTHLLCSCMCADTIHFEELLVWLLIEVWLLNTVYSTYTIIVKHVLLRRFLCDLED